MEINLEVPIRIVYMSTLCFSNTRSGIYAMKFKPAAYNKWLLQQCSQKIRYRPNPEAPTKKPYLERQVSHAPIKCRIYLCTIYMVKVHGQKKNYMGGRQSKGKVQQDR